MSGMLGLGFMQKAFLAGAIISIVLSLMSFFVVLRGMSFIGVGIAHSALGGIALGVLAGVDPRWTAIVFCVAVANLITYTSRKGALQEDAVIGIFFSLTMAAGIILIGLSKAYSVDLFGYLFGNILAVSNEDLWLAAGVGLLVLASAGVFFKELLMDSFDRELALASGIPVKSLDHLMASLIALTVVISVKLVGIVLASALLVIPGATALRLTARWQRMLGISLVAALLATFGGLSLAYFFDLAPGASIAVVSSALFFLSFLRKS